MCPGREHLCAVHTLHSLHNHAQLLCTPFPVLALPNLQSLGRLHLKVSTWEGVPRWGLSLTHSALSVQLLGACALQVTEGQWRKQPLESRLFRGLLCFWGEWAPLWPESITSASSFLASISCDGLSARKGRRYERNNVSNFTLISNDNAAAAAAAKSLQSCSTLCDPIDGSPPGSPVPGILQARTLEWVAVSFSNAGKWKVKVKSLSRVWLLGTPWTATHQAPLSMGFSRQGYWSGVPLPSPQVFLGLRYLAGGFFTKVPPYKPLISVTLGMSLVVQWLSLHLPVQRGVGSAPSWGAKISHASWPKNQNVILAKKSEDKNRSNIVTKSIKTFKMIHSKKNKKIKK